MRKYLNLPKKFEGWKEAEKFLSKDKYIAPLIKRYGHCKIKPGNKRDYFLDLVDAIISQQLSGKAALSIFNRLKEKLNGKIDPEKILKSNDEELRGCGLSWAKVKYLKDLSEKVISNKLQITSLDKLSDEEVMNELIAVKGIGKWTSEMFLMFSLARPDVFPVDDLGIRNSMKKLLGRVQKPQKLDTFSSRWKPYRTVASWYIWRSLENT